MTSCSGSNHKHVARQGILTSAAALRSGANDNRLAAQPTGVGAARAGGRGDNGTGLFGELDHVAADGSSGTVDQDRLSRRECGEIKQCLHVNAWIPPAVKVAHDAPVA